MDQANAASVCDDDVAFDDEVSEVTGEGIYSVLLKKRRHHVEDWSGLAIAGLRVDERDGIRSGQRLTEMRREDCRVREVQAVLGSEPSEPRLPQEESVDRTGFEAPQG